MQTKAKKTVSLTRKLPMTMMLARGLFAVLLVVAVASAADDVSPTSNLRSPRGLGEEVIEIQANDNTVIDIFLQDVEAMGNVGLDDSCSKTSDCKEAGSHSTSKVNCEDGKCRYSGCRCKSENDKCWKTSDCKGDLKCRDSRCKEE